MKCERSFDDLKVTIVPESMLSLLNFNKSFEVQMDPSKFSSGGVLMQEGHPIAFESHKLNDMKRRYKMQEKEMTAIVHYLQV